ncbi:Phage baseplate assembly protein V (modular protein) [uncultured Alphaproteobacteria bacterium]|uniref:Phage baseplate assembly protein V (Modular protein) n=1 Tax=uncultured Alphaproteobacteria bacterium TaxID=91750 RepID=A0A212KMZ7_9PROT|nr:Phage baseplate assembly protein V (modular protein) [uncultured Alphaproteobacteria bacterium]
MLDLALRITELERRVANIVRIGAVSDVDVAAARAVVSIGRLTTAPLPWLTRRAGADRDWWAPSVGEQVLVLAVGGDLAQGVILPALYADAAPAPADSGSVHRTVYADGTLFEHDSAAKITRLSALDAEGTLILEAKTIVLRTGEGGTYHLDHAGYAQRLTHLGGPAFETETWHAGAVVTGLPDNGFSPPKVTIDDEEP